MREIKFRAWDTALETMDGPFGFEDITAYGQIFANGVDLERCSEYIFMQYTGLKDKNGVEIYEGDLLRWIDWEEELTEEPDVYRVDWLDKEARFSLNCFRNGKQLDPKDDVFQPGDEFEVIGNIYENKELLNDN